MSASLGEISKLLQEAEETLRTLRVTARRAFVLEVTGTPKAGKTSTLALTHGFFRRAGYRVETLKERAADCPIPMKGHFFFNAWTACTMISNVLATHDTDFDLIILDRGFFDSLIWLNLQLRRGQITEAEASTFEKFVLLDRWRSLVDLTIVMTASPETAMAREDFGTLVPRKGSLMNPDALAAFNAAIDETAVAHEKSFKILRHRDQGDSAKDSATNLISLLLPEIQTWANQQILVAPREEVKRLFTASKFIYKTEARAAWQALQPYMSIRARHEAENNDDVVQIVGCGIAIHRTSLFLFKRTTKDEKTAYGRSILWKGCHIQGPSHISVEDVAQQTLQRLLEELHLRSDLDLPLNFWGLAWTDSSVPESRHLGVFFAASIEDEIIANSMEEKEFRKAGRGHAMVGKFHSRQQLLQSMNEIGLEPWSQFVIQNVGLEDPE